MAGPVTDERAGVLLQQYLDCYAGPRIPVPIHSIAEDLLGLHVAETDELQCSGLLVPGERRIWLNAREARESPGRRRFTVAHEVGHWVCQVLEGRWQPVHCRAADLSGFGVVDATGSGAGPTDGGAGHVRPAKHPPLEREANVFAAELLMPEEAVRDAHAEDDSIEGLAERFGVSDEAMHWRLFNFGLIDRKP